MRRRQRKPVEPSLDLKKAQQLLKCSAVLLRDHTPLTFEDVILVFAYCWQHTESIEAAEKRERALLATK